MDDFKIDKGIPMEKASKYPIKEMEEGDSFFIPIEHLKARDSLYSCAKYAGKKIAIRKREEDGVVGYRIWCKGNS